MSVVFDFKASPNDVAPSSPMLFSVIVIQKKVISCVCLK